MHKQISFILIITMFFSLFSGLSIIPSSAMASETSNNSVIDAVYSVDENVETVPTVEDAVYGGYGIFSKEVFEQIDKTFSSKMKQIASYYYSEITRLISKKQLLDMLSWSNKDVADAVNRLDPDERDLLAQLTPNALIDYNHYYNLEEKLQSLGIHHSSVVDSTYDYSVVESTYDSDSAPLKRATATTMSSEWDYETGNRYKFDTKNASYNYQADTSGDVEPILKTSTQQDIDVYLPGRNGLDVSLIRSYNSLDSKIIVPHYDGDSNCDAANSDYKNNGKSDCMGNWAQSAKKYIPDNPGYIATGWELNIPYMKEEVIKSLNLSEISTGSDYKRYVYNRENSGGIEALTFHLDDGSTYQFREGSTKPHGHPYDNVRYTKSDGKYILTINDIITYEFDDDGDILSKSNQYGDRITYRSSNSYYTITDTVGRTISIERYSGRIRGIEVTNAAGATLYNISYNTTSKKELGSSNSPAIRIFDRDSIDRYTYQLLEVEYFQLDSVIDRLNNKVLKTYTYKELGETTTASFNYEDDYFYKSKRGSSTPDLDEDGAEASSIVKRDLQTFGEIIYLLLNTVESDTGFKTQYQYRPYKQSWHNLPDFVDRDDSRGTTNLYIDEDTLLYFGYHQVQAVYYVYTDSSGIEKVLEEEYAGSWVIGIKNEIWSRPKKKIKSDSKNFPYRLENSSIFRRGDLIQTEKFTRLSDYNISETSYYMVNETGKYLHSYTESSPGITDWDEITEDGWMYFEASKQITSSYYPEGAIQPSMVFSVTTSGSKSKSVPSTILEFAEGKSKEIPANLADYATITTYAYDNYGYVTKQTDPVGNTTEAKYEGPRHQISYSRSASADGLNLVEQTYAYNTDETLASVTQKTTYRDSNGEQKSDSIITKYDGFNSFKQPTLVTETSSGDQYSAQPITTTNQFVYDAQGLNLLQETAQVTLESGKAQTALTLSYTYDDYGRATKQIFPDKSSASYTYDYKGRILTETFTPTSGAARTTSYVYDDANRKTIQTFPDGKKAILYYTAYGEVEKQLAQSGNEERIMNKIETDESGVLVKATLPYGNEALKSMIEYSGNGKEAEVTNALGETTYYSYANAAYKTDGTAVYGQTTTKVVEPDGKETWTYEDRMGNVTKVVEKTPTKTRTTLNSYNTSGQLIQQQVIANGQTQTTKYSYDGSGNLAGVIDAKGQTYRYVYNSLGQVIAIYMDGKLTQSKVYNEAGWLLSKTNASGQSERYIYNNNGSLASYTDKSNQTHSYTYSPYYEVDRESVKNSAGTEILWQQYTYDPTTRELLEIRNSDNETLAYTYDKWGRMSNQKVAGRSYTFAYDAYDRLATLTYPDTKTVTYDYDNLSRIAAVTYAGMGRTNYTYATGSNAHTYTIGYASGATQTRVTDGFGELTTVNQTNNSGTVQWSETYGYDGFGNIANINRNGTAYTYAYDSLNRIAKETLTSGGERAYTYDARGNRLTVSGQEFSVDAATMSYTYNGKNQLTAVQKDGTQAAKYTYYGDGLRASKQVGSDFTRYVYLNGRVIEELDASGNVKARNIWGNELLYREDLTSGQAGYYYYNGHGDVTSVKRADGTVLNAYDYDIWGNILSSTESMSNPFKYTSEIYDEETGFYYLRARYYDPSIGRFINEDTYEGQIDNPLSLNLYTYVHNNPLRYSDPSGHMPHALLNGFLLDFIGGREDGTRYTNWELSNAVFNANGNSDKGRYKALHEIAQIHASAKIHSELGLGVQLEYKVTEKRKYWFDSNYYVDIVATDGQMWEVKARRDAPFGGTDGYYEDAEAQLDKYSSLNDNLKRGVTLSPIEGIVIVENLRMNIEFIENGKILYDFYLVDGDGEFFKTLTTSQAEDYVEATHIYPPEFDFSRRRGRR